MAISLKYVQTINTTPALVYRAFTNSTAMRQWLCDTASIDPRPGGRFFIAWNSGYYANGEYTKVQPGKEINFIWQGRDDPAPSRVRGLIDALDNGMSTLTLEHFALENNHEWASALKQIGQGWAKGLLNLVSTLESGPDLRILNRPMLGIVFADFDKERCAELGIPVSAGMRIDTLVEGMGALAAGLHKNDVIISLDGKPTPDYPALITSLQHHKAGDFVEICYYRGARKKKAKMQLSGRIIPEIPMTSAGLAAAVSQNHSTAWVELTKILTNVTEEEASFRSAAGEWTVKETIAHLLHDERTIQANIQDLVFSEERVADGFSNNLDARIRATVAAYENLERLLDAYKRSQAETVALLSELPEEFVCMKGSFWRLGLQLLQINSHAREHAGQISLAVSAARH
jgi:uncharacterized protein YndB with AHSA1/START domain